MKTYQPNLKPKANLSLLDIKLGSVIEILDQEHNMKRRFIVVGMSLSHYAFVATVDRNFETLFKSRSLPGREVSLFETRSSVLKLFADCSKILVRRFGDLGNWLKKYPESYLGNLIEDDVDELVKMIKESRTISANTKKEFFL